MNPTRLHKLFHAWVGVTPKAFLQCLTINRAKRLLADGESVLQTSLLSGLSGPGRLHDLCCKLEAASPGEIKNAGLGWEIHYAIVDTPFAQALLAQSPRGICHISFIDNENPDHKVQALQAQWRNAQLVKNDQSIGQLARRIFPNLAASTDVESVAPLRALVAGTDFQIKVWRALVQIPIGEVMSYKQLASRVGHPGAARAVGTAMADNPLAYLIPCHRVIRETGVIGEYRWGSQRKRCMLAWEHAYAASSSSNDLSK